MALEGKFFTNGYGNGRCLVFVWSGKQSISGNYTTISWRLQGSHGTYGEYYKSGNFLVTIDGEDVFESATRIQLYSDTVVAEGTKTLYHDADGTRTFSAYAEAGIYDYAVNCKGSGTWTLDTIPRAAEITKASDFTDEQNPSIEFRKAVTGSTISAWLEFSDYTGTTAYALRDGIENTGTYTWELTEAEKNSILSICTKNSNKCKFVMLTVIDGVEYWDSEEVTFKIVNANPKLTFSVQCDDATFDLTKNREKLIKYFSSATATMTAEAQKGATINVSKYSMRNGENKVDGVTSHTFKNIESNIFNFYAEDSRGNTTIVNGVTPQVTLTMIDYTPLTCNLASNKPDGDGDLTVYCSGSYYNGAFSDTVPNTLTVQCRYAVMGEDFTDDWTDMEVAKNGNYYSAVTTVKVPDYQLAYSVEVKAEDLLTLATDYETGIVSIPTFHWGKDDFVFEVPVEVKGNAKVESLSVDNTALKDFVTEQGTLGNWTYRKWKSGVMECWGTFTFKTKVTEAWGSLYIGNNPINGFSYPFPFASKPVETVTLQISPYAGWLFTKESSGVNSSQQTAAYNVCRPTATEEEQTLYLSFYVKGEAA